MNELLLVLSLALLFGSLLLQGFGRGSRNESLLFASLYSFVLSLILFLVFWVWVLGRADLLVVARFAGVLLFGLLFSGLVFLFDRKTTFFGVLAGLSAGSLALALLPFS